MTLIFPLYSPLWLWVEKPVAHHIPNAVLDGDFEFLESIIYSNRDMVDYIGPAGFAAMHVATYKKDMGMVDMLLKVSHHHHYYYFTITSLLLHYYFTTTSLLLHYYFTATTTSSSSSRSTISTTSTTTAARTRV
jgi:hypothetical protein